MVVPSNIKIKNKFKNLTLHEKDFGGIQAEWHFFPTSHGKGPCDGIGGAIKRVAKEASIKSEWLIKDAKEFYNWATNKTTKEKHFSKKDWEFVCF